MEKEKEILEEVKKFLKEACSKKSKSQLAIDVNLDGEVFLKTNIMKKYAK